MPSDKDGFVSYKSHFKALEHLSDELLGQLFRAVYHYQISGAQPATDSPIYFPFAFMKLSFDADDLKYQAVIERNKANGAKGGRRANNPDEPKEPSGFSGNPDEPKKADKDKDKDKDKDPSKNEGRKGPSPAPSPLPSAKKEPETYPDEAPVFQRENFFAFARKIQYGHADLGHYLGEIQLKAERLNEQRTAEGWETYVLSFFKNEVKHNRLILPVPEGGFTGAKAVPTFGPAPTPTTTTTNYSHAAIVQAQSAKTYF